MRVGERRGENAMLVVMFRGKPSRCKVQVHTGLTRLVVPINFTLSAEEMNPLNIFELVISRETCAVGEVENLRVVLAVASRAVVVAPAGETATEKT